MSAWLTALCAMLGAAVLVDYGQNGPPAGAKGHSGHEIRYVPAADVTGPPLLSRNGWTVTADSQETVVGPHYAANVLDGDPNTMWHTKWGGGADPLPHTLTIDMHATQQVGGLTYLPRIDGPNGRIGQYQIGVSGDGTTWQTVASGTFADDATLKTITFAAAMARFVRLTALTEAGNRGPWSSAAEINLLASPDPVLARTGWTATADSQETVLFSHYATNVLDGDPTTFWHTKWSGGADPLPHMLTIDMHQYNLVSGLSYLARQDGVSNGNIGQYRIETSMDAVNWGTPVSTGTFADTASAHTVCFAASLARYVRLTALTEAGNRGPWSSAAEINLLGPPDPVLARTGWTASADSQETVVGPHYATNVLDGDPTTMWHTKWGGGADPLPHTLTIDMHATQRIGGLTYLPRFDGPNGRIGQYQIGVSTNGTTWQTVANGTFADDPALKTLTFAPAMARFVRLTALTEAGNRGPWSSAAEINLLASPDPVLARTGWTATADSQETVVGQHYATNVLDGDPNTMWHTKWDGGADPLPHTLTIDMHATQRVSGLTYLPRDDGPNGRIGQYQIGVSTNGTTWQNVASGTFADDAALKTVTFPAAAARYVRLVANTEAGGRGPWSSAAEIYLRGSPDASKGAWSAPVGFPLVPVAAALLPNGKILTWSANAPDDHTGTGQTITAIYDPATGVVSQRLVTETGHDMFCPGIALLPDGRILVAGGEDSGNTSIYDPATDAWTAGPKMNIPRGYQADVTLSDGRVFTIGGSWSGGRGGKDAEVWSAQGGWQTLPGAPATPILTNDSGGIYRQDNHAWLFAWSGGMVFQAGPSKAMNWFNPTGTGSTTPAGLRGDDGDAMNGNAVMYDAGKILTIGGAPSYQFTPATGNANVITLNGTNVTVRPVAPMANARSFLNSVVLPDGKVAAFGGMTYPVAFSDNTAVLTPELWDPTTEAFTTLAPALVPRTYHSVALLLPDGRVFTGGGGLCGATCGVNHFDSEVFTPPYLLNPDGTAASRPTITAAPDTATNGATITVATDRPVTGFSVIRMGAATHSVDTDQRRIALAPTAVTGGYSLTIPADPGVAVPGYYMLFALDSRGVPSVAKIIRIGQPS